MLIVAAVLTSEVPDVSGEVLIVKGADIEALKTGTAPINTEHHNPEDIEKIDKDFGGFNTVIGRVISAKKIYNQDDCENEYELDAWSDLQVPFIFGYLEFFDGDHAHDNARAASAIVRMGNQSKDKKFIMGFSVEGHTLKTSGENNQILEETVIKRIAATLKPANKSAVVRAVLHDSLQDSFLKKSEKNKKQFFNAEKILNDILIYNKLSYSLALLQKSLTAGTPSVMPSALTDGAALQKPNKKFEQLNKLLKKVNIRKLKKSDLKQIVGDLPEENLDLILKSLKVYHFNLLYQLADQAYQDMTATLPSFRVTRNK